MITKGDKIVFGLIIVCAILAFFFFKNRKETSVAKAKEVKESPKEQKKDKKKDRNEQAAGDGGGVTIIKKWDMPADLLEISGISSLGDNRFACVQDELGVIFIFNTATNKIEKQIPFADAGDYEGIAIVDAAAYVLRADGKLFEVQNYYSNKPVVVQYSTHLTAKQDVEGLCYDQKNDRLLLAIKGKDPTSKDYKGIYAFDLASKKLAAAPVYKVGLASDASGEGKGKNKIQPSDLSIHPATGDIYIIDGPNSRLLVLAADGTKKDLYQLNTSDFPQPEGIAFTPSAGLFISNEGGDGTGNILQVAVDGTGL